MTARIGLVILPLCILVLLVPLAFYGDLWGILPSTAPALTNVQHLRSHLRRISHQAASETYQDVLPNNAEWFDTDGTPIFYSAWRARPGWQPPEPTARSQILEYGARVACWPVSGGIWIKHADMVDMMFLGLDRFLDTPRQFNQTAEDEFCTKLRMVGAEWWRLPPDFGARQYLGKGQYACRTLETCFAPTIANSFLLAWPETTTTACYVPVEFAKRKSGMLLNGYRNAMDMEERCRVINGLGGTECLCKAQCPELAYLDWGIRALGDAACDSWV